MICLIFSYRQINASLAQSSSFTPRFEYVTIEVFNLYYNSIIKAISFVVVLIGMSVNKCRGKTKLTQWKMFLYA